MKLFNTFLITTCLFIFIFIIPQVANGQNQNVKVEDFGVIPILKKFEPGLITFEIMDQKPINSQYSAIVVHAQSETISHGKKDWDAIKRAEVFGVFIIEQVKQQPVITIDIFYTQRLFDYEVKFREISEDHLTVVGQGMTYGDQPLNIKYFFNLKENKLLKKVEFNSLYQQSIIAYHDAIFFLGYNNQNSILIMLSSPHNYSKINQYQVIDQIEGNAIPKLQGFNIIEDKLYLDGEKTNYVFVDNTWKVSSKQTRSGLQAGENYLAGPDGFTIFNPDSSRTKYPFPSQDDAVKKYCGQNFDSSEIYLNCDMRMVLGNRVENKVWFGNHYYSGEGCVGVGCIGYFDLTTKQYQMFYPDEIRSWSISAVYADTTNVLAGLVINSECPYVSEGMVKYEISSQKCTKYNIPNIITAFGKYDNLYFVGTDGGIYIVDGDKLTRIGISFDITNNYFMYFGNK